MAQSFNALEEYQIFLDLSPPFDFPLSGLFLWILHDVLKRVQKKVTEVFKEFIFRESLFLSWLWYYIGMHNN